MFRQDFQVVGEAQNGLEAIEYARTLHPDIIVMDVNMPKLNGIEATRRIIQEFPLMANYRAVCPGRYACPRITAESGCGHVSDQKWQRQRTRRQVFGTWFPSPLSLGGECHRSVLSGFTNSHHSASENTYSVL